uniref:Ig-like domain-containing protein n=1 Tax=Amphiprion percula TaxID=161767 RepID=A0A3P8S6J8_AMPPE
PQVLPPPDQAVIEGQEVTMSVRISGQPKPMLYWLRDRVTVKTGPRHVVCETEDGTFVMTIKSAVRSDSGIYTCRIINEYGTKQCEGRLEVKGMFDFFLYHGFDFNCCHFYECTNSHLTLFQ